MTTLTSPLVSIIIPVYNVEQYLDDCINSIKEQTYDNLEIIVVEDCSTDNSLQVLKPHLTDQRIKLIQHTHNQGLSAARNIGIEAVEGDYVMFVDSDDIVDVRLVGACVECVRMTNADLVTYGLTAFADGVPRAELPYSTATLTKATLHPKKHDDDYFGLDYYACLKFIRSDILKRSNIRFSLGLHYEDWPVHWQLGLSVENKYALPADLYFYRKRSTSITGSYGRELLDVFTAQLHVMKLLEEYKADDLKPLLADRIKHLNFYLLTVIDKAHIASALKKAMTVEKSMQKNNYKREIGYQVVALKALAKMPETLALPALKAFRLGLHDVFFPTRQSYRQWRQKHKQQ